MEDIIGAMAADVRNASGKSNERVGMRLNWTMIR